jgi:hypothetical protein
MAHAADPDALYHFSEDPGIDRFVPHVPATNPDQLPMVWAVDAVYQPLFWFPRECPRVTVWPAAASAESSFASAFATNAHRLHAIETAWYPRLRSVSLYRYRFAVDAFTPWPGADGYWVAVRSLAPVSVEPVGDLVALHLDAGIELRVLPNLWPLIDAVVAGPHRFSIARKHNAGPRIGD